MVVLAGAAWGWGAEAGQDVRVHAASLPRERKVEMRVTGRTPVALAGGLRYAENPLSVFAVGAAKRVHPDALRGRSADGRRSPWTARDAPVAPQASRRVSTRQAKLPAPPDTQVLRHTVNPLSAFAVSAAGVSRQAPGNLVKIEVRGAERLSAERVIETSGLRTGQAMDRAALQAAVERMMATGLFERVNWRTQPGEGGVTVTLTVREAPGQQSAAEHEAGPKIERVEVRGLTLERNDLLRNRLEAPMSGRAFSPEMAEEVAGPLVRATLAESGHWSPAVTYKMEAGSVLAVEISEGLPATLGEVTMEGGDPQWLDGAGYMKGAPAESKKLNLALGRVVQAARNAGYLAATAHSEPSVMDGRLNLKLVLEPGPLYRFGELRIEGLDAQREKRARALWKLKPGDAAGEAALEEWIRLVFERRIPVWDRVQRAWRPRQGEPIADAVVSFR